MTDPRTRQAFSLHRLDDILEQSRPFNSLSGLRRFIVEFLYFGIKEARACLFVGLFFLAVFLVPRGGILGVARYDILLFIALAIQAIMLIGKLETWDEAKAIALFHALGFALEVFKTSGALPSWSYPDPGLSKFSVFLYFPASCTRVSAPTSYKLGGYSTCVFAITHRIG